MKSTGAGSPEQTWRHPKKNWVRGFENAVVKVCRQGKSAAKTGRTKDERLLAKLYAAKGGPNVGRTKTCLRPFKYRPKASGDLAWAL